MREVYYRAWHKEHKIMCDALSIDFVNRSVWILPEDLEGASQEEWKFSDIELLQYTGLKDKNGKEIYEGDLIRFREGETAQVLYNAPSFILSLEDRDLAWWAIHGAVIGNIYERPGLLKGIE